MFKFDFNKVLDQKRLGETQFGWVCPYKEGYSDNEWVVKYVCAKDQQEMNTTLENLFLINSSNSVGLLPVKGYDVQINEHGGYNIYYKMPRMQGSLRSVIDGQYDANGLLSSTEKLVFLTHSITTTLSRLAQNKVFHRNLKPTNVLLEKTGAVFLSDLRMAQLLTDTNSEDILYIAPEALSGDWSPNEEDIQKADVWSLGMIIAKICLLEKLIPVPADSPLQEKHEAVEENLEAIRKRYGSNLSRILADLLNINPVNRRSFSEISLALEQTFPYILAKGSLNGPIKQESARRANNHNSFYQDSSFDHFLQVDDGPMFRQRQSFKGRQDYEDPSMDDKYGKRDYGFYNDAKMFVGSLISKISQGAKRFKEGKGAQIYQKAKHYKDALRTEIGEKAKNFKEGKGAKIYGKAKDLKESIGSRIYKKFKYFKDVGRFQLYEKIGNGVKFMKKHKFKILIVIMAIIFIIALVLVLQYQANQKQLSLERERIRLETEAYEERVRLEREEYEERVRLAREEQEIKEKYQKAIKGTTIKTEHDVKVYPLEYGALAVELQNGNRRKQVQYQDYYGRVQYREEIESTPVQENYNESVWAEFISELTKELKNRSIIGSLKDLRFKSNKQATITNEGLQTIAARLSALKALKKLQFFQISGNDITVDGFGPFLSSISQELTEIESLGVGLINCPSIKEISSIASSVLTTFTNLKELTLEFEEISITNEELKKLSSIINEKGQALTSLSIRIAACEEINDDGFKQFNSEFFKNLTNLEFLTLDYQKTKISNKAMMGFSEEISKHCTNLQSLIIKTAECDHISAQAPKFLAHQLNEFPLQKLRHFEFTGGIRLYDAESFVRQELRYVSNIRVT